MLAAEYEEFVARFVKDLYGLDGNSVSTGHFGLTEVQVDVQREFTRVGSGRSIFFDVTLEARFPGGRMLFVFGCKHYTKKVGVGVVDEFVGKLGDLRDYGHAHKGFIVTRNGFQAGAKESAAAAGIALWLVRELEEGQVFHAVIQESWDETSEEPDTTTQGQITSASGKSYDFWSASGFLRTLSQIVREPAEGKREV